VACFLRLLTGLQATLICGGCGRITDARGFAAEKSENLIEISVTFVGLIQRLVGRREETLVLPQETVLDGLLRELIARYGQELEERLLENGELAAHATVLINGRNALTQGGLEAKLGDGSQSHVEIVVLGPPLMGG
jgi:molybdopterin converting factor small subunit